jgi:hypothetical protein
MSKTIKGLHVLLLIAACTSIGYASGAVRPPEKAPPKNELPVVSELTVVNPVAPATEIVATPINYMGVEFIEVIVLNPSGALGCMAQSPVAAIKKECSKFVGKYLGCERYYSCGANRFKPINYYPLALPNYNLRT